MRILTLLIILTSLFILFNHPLSPDEGIVLDGAWKMYNGQHLYKDFFSLITPGSFLITKLSFDLLGPTYFSARLFTVILLLTSAFAIYHIAFLIKPSKTFSMLAAWLWIFVNSFSFQLINYNSQSSYLSVIAIYCLLKALMAKTKLAFFLCGFSAGIIILFLQSKGFVISLLFLAVIIWYIVIKKIGRLSPVFFILGLSIVPILIGEIWGYKLSFDNFLLWPIKNVAPVPNRALPYNISQFYILLFIVLSISSLKIKKINLNFAKILILVQISLFLLIYSRLDPEHLLVNSFGFVVITLLVLFHFFEKYHLLNLVTQNKFVSFYFLSLSIVTLFSFFSNSTISYLNFMDTIKVYRFTKFYSHPFAPNLYFEFKINDPYPYNFLVTRIHPESAFLQNLSVLKKEDPPYVLTYYQNVLQYNFDKSNSIDSYLRERYKEVGKINNLTILQKN